jgi:hypothetical protein
MAASAVLKTIQLANILIACWCAVIACWWALCTSIHYMLDTDPLGRTGSSALLSRLVAASSGTSGTACSSGLER